MVVASASLAWTTLVRWAKEDTAYLGDDTMATTSAHRSQKHQAEICNTDPSGRCQAGDYTFIAPPGGSWHEKGANDLRMNGAPNNSASCKWKKVSGIRYCDYPGESKLRNWMMVNAPYVGLYQYPNEYWHFDPNIRSTTWVFKKVREEFLATPEGKAVPDHGIDTGTTSAEPTAPNSEVIVGQSENEQSITLPEVQVPDPKRTSEQTAAKGPTQQAQTETQTTTAQQDKEPKKDFWSFLGF